MALATICDHLRPGATIAAGGGKWPSRWLWPLREFVTALHRPYVRDFTGFDQPWRLLADHVTRLRVTEVGSATSLTPTPRPPPKPPTVFAAMGDTKVPLSEVFDGIAAAADAGLVPIKLNTALRRGMNEAGLLDLVEFARDAGYVLRCIEYMDVGNTNGWDRSEVINSAEVLDRIAAVHPVEPVAAARPGEVDQRWRYLDGHGEFGLISSVSTPFCSSCTRARLTAVGEPYTCLFAAHGRDLRGLLRGGVDDDALHAAIAAAIAELTERIEGLAARRTVLVTQLREAAHRTRGAPIGEPERRS